jgi:hypothetical protein
MTGRHGDLETRLRALTPPALPGELKRRVMAEARLAPRPSWRDRAWYSRGWRLGAVAMLLAIFAADRWSAGMSRADAVTPPALAADEKLTVDAVGKELGMPPEAMERLVARAEFVPLTARETRGQAMRAAGGMEEP